MPGLRRAFFQSFLPAALSPFPARRPAARPRPAKLPVSLQKTRFVLQSSVLALQMCYYKGQVWRRRPPGREPMYWRNPYAVENVPLSSQPAGPDRVHSAGVHAGAERVQPPACGDPGRAAGRDERGPSGRRQRGARTAASTSRQTTKPSPRWMATTT